MVLTLQGLRYRFFEVNEGNPKLVETNLEALFKRVTTDLQPEIGHYINLLAIQSGSDRFEKLDELR